jgi:ATP-dependent Lon protease
LREYLEFAMEGRRRVKEQLKKLAPHDYAKTSFSYIERDTGHEIWVDVLEQPEDVELIEKTEVTSDSDEIDGVKTIEELIAAGESRTVEFKSSARWGYQKGDRDPVVEQAVVKAVAGFMNAHGGTLLIGIDDEGKPIGLANDYKLVKGKNRDGLENWLTDLLEKALGKPAVANAAVSFAAMDGEDVCRIDVRPSPIPVYAQRGNESDLFVRLNNSTRLLNTSEAVTYIGQHWSRRL